MKILRFPEWARPLRQAMIALALLAIYALR